MRGALCFVPIALGVGCGDSEDAEVVGNAGTGGSSAGAAGEAGAAGSSAGAAGAAGATGGTAGATGGTAGSSGGTAGSGGAAGGAGAGAGGTGGVECDPPADPSKAALCIGFVPENVTLEADPDLDGQGVLVVQVFDVAQPEAQDGGPDRPPIAETIYPAQSGDAGPQLTALANLPVLRFDGLPSTVYVRTLFADNLQVFQSERPMWGNFIGGADLSQGLRQGMPLDAVALTPGAGTSLAQPLVALRKLEVTVSLAGGVVPLDDAQGPADFIALDTGSPGPSAAAFGFGGGRCRDLSAGASATLHGFVIGPGQRWVAASLDDFGTGEASDVGEILSLSVDDAGVPVVPDAHSVMVGAAYRYQLSLELGLVVPLDEAGAPPSFQCPVPDAATD